MQIINFFRRGFCFFDVRTAKKNIDALISKRQKPLEKRLANNLSRTPEYFLLTSIYFLLINVSVPDQILRTPKLQHFSVELYHLDGVVLFLVSERTC